MQLCSESLFRVSRELGYYQDASFVFPIYAPDGFVEVIRATAVAAEIFCGMTSAIYRLILDQLKGRNPGPTPYTR